MFASTNVVRLDDAISSGPFFVLDKIVSNSVSIVFLALFSPDVRFIYFSRGVGGMRNSATWVQVNK